MSDDQNTHTHSVPNVKRRRSSAWKQKGFHSNRTMLTKMDLSGKLQIGYKLDQHALCGFGLKIKQNPLRAIF